jgi:hypothetical protein
MKRTFSFACLPGLRLTSHKSQVTTQDAVKERGEGGEERRGEERIEEERDLPSHPIHIHIHIPS